MHYVVIRTAFNLVNLLNYASDDVDKREMSREGTQRVNMTNAFLSWILGFSHRL